MNELGGITAKVNLPPVTQIGVVVRDLDQAMEYYSKTLGLGPFNPVFELAPDKSWYMGKESPLRLQDRQDPVGPDGSGACSTVRRESRFIKIFWTPTARDSITLG